MITKYEKEMAIQHANDLTSLLVNTSEGALYYKMFANFIAKYCPTKKLSFEDYDLCYNNVMVNSLSEILDIC